MHSPAAIAALSAAVLSTPAVEPASVPNTASILDAPADVSAETSAPHIGSQRPVAASPAGPGDEEPATPPAASTTDVSAETPVRPTGSLDDDETAFGETGTKRTETEASVPASSGAQASAQQVSAWDVLGRSKRITLSHETGYQLGNSRGLVSNRAALRLEWAQSLASWAFASVDAKLFGFFPGDHRAQADGGEARAFANLREAYLQLSLADTSVTLGQQVIVWGESEGGIVTDVISPRDFTEFLFPTVEDSRLGIPAITVDQYSSWGTFSLVVVPYAVHDRQPDPRSQYALGRPTGEVTEQPWKLGDGEVGLRWRQTLGNADLSVMGATVLDNQATLTQHGVSPKDGRPRLRSRNRRYSMAGAAASLAVGNALLKAELAYGYHRAFQRAPLGVARRDTADAVIGVEYTFADTTMVAVEAGTRHILRWDAAIAGANRTDPFAAVMLMRNLLNDTLRLMFLAIAIPRERVALTKLYATYAVTDVLSFVVDGGAVLIEADSAMAAFRDKHRLNFRIELRY